MRGQHTHLQEDFRACVRRQFPLGRTTFGYPKTEIDPISLKETFQAGGTLQVVRGNLTTMSFGPPISDLNGLGRWCGNTFIGKGGPKFSAITGYRTCFGSIQSAPLGTTFHREYEYFRDNGVVSPQPRTRFFKDLSQVIKKLPTQHWKKITRSRNF